MMPRSPREEDIPIDSPEGEHVTGRTDEWDDSAVAAERPDSIARRAYERFQERGGEHGRDQEDWFEAERELDRNRRD